MKRTALLLAQGFEELEAAAFTDVLGWSRVVGGEPVEVVTVGLRPEIRCTWNLTVIPEVRAAEFDPGAFDALAIPGGFQKAGFYEDAYHEDFLEIIRRFHAAQKPIAAVCVAALALGRSGVLAGRRATTYHLLDGLRRRQLAEMGALVEDEHVVADGHLITSSCPATALEVAFRLLGMLVSARAVAAVREAMGFPPA